jgi:hypothetical protein
VPDSATRPRIEHVDAVGVAHGREPVRDDHRRAPTGDARQRALDGGLGLVVDGDVASSSTRRPGP